LRGAPDFPIVALAMTTHRDLASPPVPPATLVARFGALGDMVMLLPALEVLARGGTIPCEVVTSLKVASTLYAGIGSVGAVTLVHSKRTPYPFERSQQKFVRGLRTRASSGRVGSALSFTVVPRVPWLLRKGGLSASAMVTHQDLPRGELEHDIEYGERMVRELLGKAEEPTHLPAVGEWPAPRLAVSASELGDTTGWLEAVGWRQEPIVLLQTQSRKARRGRWPNDRWLGLVRFIRSTLPEAHIMFTGVPAEEEALMALVAAANDAKVTCVAGAIHLRRLCALASIAHSMVSLDTGPAHIAAAVGCPLVVLFGSEHPHRTRPTGLRPSAVQEVAALPELDWPDSREEFATRHTMADIPLGAVEDAWARLCAVDRVAP
jgi:ADP-heptose:LPS heptosyltransferase